MNSARNSVTHCCDPARAAIAAFCTKLVAFDVDCPCSLFILATIAFGASANPALQPVIESVFESDPATLIIEALSSEQEPEDVSLRVFRRLAETTGSDVPSLVAFLERPRPALTEELLAKVSCPVLLVLGERDAPAPTRLLASLPDAELVMLPGVDHFSTPQDFGAIDATMRFLGLD